MFFISTPERSTLTLSRAELAALVGVAGKDASKPMKSTVQIDPAERVCVSTDGHRLIMATVGPKPIEPMSAAYIDATARKQAEEIRLMDHAEECATDRRCAPGRAISIERVELARILKIAPRKSTIEIAWIGARVSITVLGCPGVFTCSAKDPALPKRWRMVLPKSPRRLAASINLDANMIAEGAGLLAKVIDSKISPITVWTAGSDLDPVGFSSDVADENGNVAWCYVIMPIKADFSTAPWHHVPAVASMPAASQAA